MAAQVPELGVLLQEKGLCGLRVESGGDAPAGFCLSSGRGMRQSLSGQVASADSRMGHGQRQWHPGHQATPAPMGDSAVRAARAWRLCRQTHREE